MSTYYSYYIGYQTADVKLHAYGPYDCKGNLCPILEKSRSFISDLPDDFWNASIEMLDEELTKKFVYKGYNDRLETSLRFLPINELPTTDFIKKGYFLKDEVIEHIAHPDEEFYPTESYSVEEYAAKAASIISNFNGINKDEVEDLQRFYFYCYPDYNSCEFESFILRHTVSVQGPFTKLTWEKQFDDKDLEGVTPVILLNIG
jgi:hypothetical protein